MPNPNNIKGKGFDKHPENINRKGQPRKLPQLEVIIAEVLGELSPSGVPAATAILKALRARAAKGDVRAAELLFDRAYGKAKQIFDHNITEIRKTINDLFPPDNEI